MKLKDIDEEIGKLYKSRLESANAYDEKILELYDKKQILILAEIKKLGIFEQPWTYRYDTFSPDSRNCVVSQLVLNDDLKWKKAKDLVRSNSLVSLSFGFYLYLLRIGTSGSFVIPIREEKEINVEEFLDEYRIKVDITKFSDFSKSRMKLFGERND